MREFQSAELIISKGQGNFEGLSDVPGPIFFLFKVKCPVIARETAARIGTVILRGQREIHKSMEKPTIVMNSKEE
jgi:uncharacterized protein with ATP-grasp and redox domains